MPLYPQPQPNPSSGRVSTELLQKIKQAYSPFLTQGIESLLIVRAPTSHKEENGYCLLLGKNEIEFRKKSTYNAVKVKLNLTTGIIQSTISFKENFNFFSTILSKALQDVSDQKANLYSVKEKGH